MTDRDVSTNAAREAFERNLNSTLATRKNAHGDYVLPSIQDRWADWEECWKLLVNKED